jgi:hypothetical protein
LRASALAAGIWMRKPSASTLKKLSTFFKEVVGPPTIHRHFEKKSKGSFSICLKLAGVGAGLSCAWSTRRQPRDSLNRKTSATDSAAHILDTRFIIRFSTYGYLAFGLDSLGE